MKRIFKTLCGKNIIFYLLLGFMLMNVCIAKAQVSPATPGIQAIMFSKIFSYVRSIDEGNGYTVIVIYDNSSGYPDDMIDAFRDEGIKIIPTRISELADNKNRSEILYIPPNLSDESFIEVSKLKDKLLITGDPGYIISGKASLSVGLENEKIKILINLNVLEGEGHQVSSELINLARVIE